MELSRNMGFTYIEKVYYDDGELECIQYSDKADFNIILIEFQRFSYMTKGPRTNLSVQVD